MRKSSYLIGTLLVWLGVFLPQYSFSENHALRTTKLGSGGGNCVEPACNLCEQDYPLSILLTIKPDRFPFKVSDITVSNASQHNMDIDFVTSHLDFEFYNLNSQYGCEAHSPLPNQIISNPSSPYLDNDGNLTVIVYLIARFCIEPNSNFPTSNFKVKLSTKFNYFNPLNGNLVGNSVSDIIHDTDLLYNCDGSIPFSTNQNSPNQGPVMNPRGPVLRNIEDSPKNFEFFSYPNPFNDQVILKLKNPNNSSYRITIFNTKGQNLFSSISRVNKENQIKLDLSNFGSGLYLIKLEGINESYTLRIIKDI